MRKIILLLIIYVIFSQSVRSQQQPTIDSLLKVLPTTAEDSNRAKILINLSRLYFQVDPEQSLFYADQALALAQKLNYKKVIIRSYQNISIYYVINNDLDKAGDYCQKAIAAAQDINDNEARCDLLNIMASISESKGDMKSSMQFVLEALKLAEEIKDTVRMITYNVNAAITYQNISDYVNAQTHLLRALKLNERIKNTRGLANTYFIISKNYLLAENDTIKALESANLSLKYSDEAEDFIQKSQTLDLLGTLYMMKKEWDQALNYLQDAVQIKSQLGIEDDWSTHYNLGELHRQQGKADQAINYYLTSLDISQEMESIDGLGACYYGLGQVYQSLKDYKKAIHYLEKGINNARAQSSPAHERDILLALANNHEGLGEYKPAYQYLEAYHHLNDSITGEEILRTNASLREQYEAEKKDKEILVLNKDKELRQAELKKQKVLKNAFTGGLGLLGLLSFFAYRNLRSRNKLRLQSIRNKIASDLHDDIGSTLNSISVYSEVAKQKSPAIIPELEQIGEASRKIIDAMSDIVWTINAKNDSFEEIILRLRSLTYNLLRAKNIEHTFRTDERLNEVKLSMEARRNFYLIFKEAINNIVKYSNASRVTISLNQENDFITLSIQDNGVGFDATQVSTGNGLLNMKSRAEEMKAQLTITSSPGNGTSVELKLNA